MKWKGLKRDGKKTQPGSGSSFESSEASLSVPVSPRVSFLCFIRRFWNQIFTCKRRDLHMR